MIVKLTHKSEVQQTPVDEEALCSSLKGAAAKLSGVPEEQLKLLYRGRHLPEDSTLKSAGIRDGGKVLVLVIENGVEKGGQTMLTDANQSASGAQNPADDPAMLKMQEIQIEVEKYEKQVEVGLQNGFGKVNPAGIVHVLTQKMEELDSLSVSGEARDQRRYMIRSINELCDRLEGASNSGG